MDVPRLIIDLAIMLTTAALVTLFFRRLKLPTILGYILVGFIIGPNFPHFMDVESTSSVETWSEIGVVIILFHIGLEFDFHKLMEVGSTAVVSAFVKMSGVMLVGYGFGMMLGMSTMDAIFLGAMLSISSTVVIQKCLEELGLMDKKFSRLVMGSLVMEDVFAVFMMVVLTTMAATMDGNSGTTVLHLITMLAYLIIWLLAGIFIVPTFMSKTMEFMNDEALTILSIGFCFMMALLASILGFSMELGAFVAGSLFAGTIQGHDVERVTMGIKDMFGAVFFLSVGMLVDPDIIVSRWTSIVPIAIVAVVAKLIFSFIGMTLSGQDLDTSVRAGAALAPIGEFSFIIASLGISLGVMDEYLYPVIVSASILTIIVTPILIKQSDHIVAFFERIIPDKLERRIESYTSDDQSEEEKTSEWRLLLKDYNLKLVIYGSIMAVAELVGCRLIYPMLARQTDKAAAAVIVTVGIYIIIAIFARPFMGKRNVAFTKLWVDRLSNRPPLMALMTLKMVALLVLAIIPLIRLLEIHRIWLFVALPLLLVVLARSRFVSTYYLQLETRFLTNLNQKTAEEKAGRENHHWFDEDYNIFDFIVPEGASYANKSIEQLAWGKHESVYVVKMKRGDKVMSMPKAGTVIKEGDRVYVIGDRKSLELFHKTVNPEQDVKITTLREFLDGAYPDAEHALECASIKVRGTESYVGKPIRKSGINARSHCMILGLERGGYATMMPNADMLIQEGDILWIIGTNDSLSLIAAQSVGKAGTHEEGSEDK